ncbi:hypothetical protein ACHAW6_002861 [Cyclotella cf. meneghiniana]
MNVAVSSGTAFSSSKQINDRQNSAILVIMKKMVSVVGGMIDLPWDDVQATEDGSNAGIMEELLSFQTNEDIGMAAGLLSEMFLSYLSLMLRVFLPSMDDFEDVCCHTGPQSKAYHVERNETLMSSKVTPDITHVKEDSSLKENGLILPIPDVTDRFDYVITQMDISRMKRSASRFLDVESMYRLPIVTYGSELVCPAYEDDTENEDFEIQDRLSGKDTQVWSWMVVPRNTNEEISRIPGSRWRGIPESISICSSNRSVRSEGENGQEYVASFDFCVICKQRFRQGECLRILPCEHRFHSTFICSNKLVEDVISRCPMCKRNDMSNTPPCSSPQQSPDKMRSGLIENVERFSGSDGSGSVPSWAFVRLGSLLSSKGSKDNEFNDDG